MAGRRDLHQLQASGETGCEYVWREREREESGRERERGGRGAMEGEADRTAVVASQQMMQRVGSEEDCVELSTAPHARCTLMPCTGQQLAGVQGGGGRACRRRAADSNMRYAASYASHARR
jgi:hypothetical protein